MIEYFKPLRRRGVIKASCQRQRVRLLEMVYRLYGGEVLSVASLVMRYGVDRRTVYRDLAILSEFFPLVRTKEGQKLDVTKLSYPMDDLSHAMLASFASNASLDVPCLDSNNINQERVRFAIAYKELPKKLGETIVQAIRNKKQCRFRYRGKEGSASTRRIDPIYLFTENGFWYVISRDYKDDKIKHFRLDRMNHFEVLQEEVTLTDEMRQEAYGRNGSWDSSSQKQRVHCYIKAEVASYFQSNKVLHPTQQIINEHADGSIELECHISHEMELLPRIQQWLPHIFIIDPKPLREKLLSNITHYLHEDDQINGVV